MASGVRKRLRSAIGQEIIRQQETLIQELKASMPNLEISATVYRNLWRYGMFRQYHGWVTRTLIICKKPHAHFFCSRCGAAFSILIPIRMRIVKLARDPTCGSNRELRLRFWTLPRLRRRAVHRQSLKTTWYMYFSNAEKEKEVWKWLSLLSSDILIYVHEGDQAPESVLYGVLRREIQRAWGERCLGQLSTL